MFSLTGGFYTLHRHIKIICVQIILKQKSNSLGDKGELMGVGRGKKGEDSEVCVRMFKA